MSFDSVNMQGQEKQQLIIRTVKYQIAALKDLAAAKFQDAVKLNCNHDSFAEATYIVYTSTSDDETQLRECVEDALSKYDSLLDKPEVETVVREINELAFRLLKKARSKSATACCLSCGQSKVYIGIVCNTIGCGNNTWGCGCYTRCEHCGASQ